MRPAADDVAPATRLARVPLRITLVALLVVLVALALVATGAGATAMLRGYLVAQQDDELRASLQEAAMAGAVRSTPFGFSSGFSAPLPWNEIGQPQLTPL